MKKIVDRLNRCGRESLDAEWELIMLSALARVGSVDYEPPLGGSANLDFMFSDTSGLRVVGDITAVSDEEVDRQNPIDPLVRELRRKAQDRQLEGSFGIAVGSGAEQSRSGRDKGCLRLPPPHQFAKHVFDSAFENFMDRIVSAPHLSHSHSVDNDEAQLSIVYSPKGSTTAVRHADYRLPRDLVRNALHNRLKKKADQIRSAGAAGIEGYRGVLVCDAGSAVFQGSTVVGTYGYEQIARHFLRKTRSVDFVAVVTIRDPLALEFWAAGKYEYDVRVISKEGSCVESSFGELLRQGLRQIPQPTRSPVNARSYLTWHANHGIAALGYGEVHRGTLSDCEMSISARATIEYLAGRIDRQRFELLVDKLWLSFLKRDLDNGAVVETVHLIRHQERDDDELLIRWGRRDAAVSPFEPTSIG